MGKILSVLIMLSIVNQISCAGVRAVRIQMLRAKLMVEVVNKKLGLPISFEGTRFVMKHPERKSFAQIDMQEIANEEALIRWGMKWQTWLLLHG